MRARSVGLWHGGWDAHGVTTSCEFRCEFLFTASNTPGTS